jgi:hypothetical protein
LTVLARSPSLLTARGHIIAHLGNQCSRCKWDEDPAVLQVVATNGNAEAVEERRKRLSRDRFYMAILDELLNANEDTPPSFRLLCLNCKFILMAEARKKADAIAPVAVAASRPPIFIWQTTLPVNLAVAGKHLFVEKEIARGAEAFVVLEDGTIYEYGKPERPVAENWEEFRCLKTGLPKAAPATPMAVVG